MRALVIAPQPFFSPRGTPLSVYYRTLTMAQLGVEIDLLTYGGGQGVEIPGVRIIRIPHFAFLGSVKVGPSYLKLFLDQFLVLWTIGLTLVHRYDFVHAHEEAVFWCRFLKPVCHFKMVYDMHSSLPQQLMQFKFSKSRLVRAVFERLERTCLLNADVVVTICPDLADYAIGAGVKKNKHVLIENSIFDDVKLKEKGDESVVEAADRISEQCFGNGGPLVVYAGTFETYQGLEVLLSAFSEVIQDLPDAHLLLVGGNPDQVQILRRYSQEIGIANNCSFTGQVSKTDAMKMSAQADVLVSPRTEGINTPLKVYEQLASGKPLVATRIRSHTQILSDEVCFLVDPDPLSMAKGILSAIEDRAHGEQIVANADALYEARYAKSAYEAKVRRLVEILG